MSLCIEIVNSFILLFLQLLVSCLSVLSLWFNWSDWFELILWGQRTQLISLPPYLFQCWVFRLEIFLCFNQTLLRLRKLCFRMSVFDFKLLKFSVQKDQFAAKNLLIFRHWHRTTNYFIQLCRLLTIGLKFELLLLTSHGLFFKQLFFLKGLNFTIYGLQFSCQTLSLNLCCFRLLSLLVTFSSFLQKVVLYLWTFTL